jgi:glycolate oxidase iron-sulfur subunit
MADKLLRRRLRAIDDVVGGGGAVIATGNIGCIEQLAAGSDKPVVHTVELLDWATGGPPPPGVDAGP